MNHNQQILFSLKSHLIQNFDKPIKDIILFGSRARGDADETSDYDILVILDSDYNWSDENRILDLCYDIDLKYNIIIDVHLMSKNEIGSLRGKQPIFVNAIKTGAYA